jgi:hypothetical protein
MDCWVRYAVSFSLFANPVCAGVTAVAKLAVTDATANITIVLLGWLGGDFSRATGAGRANFWRWVGADVVTIVV